MIFLFPKEGTILLMLDLLRAMHYWFHIEVFTIILQNGAVHL